MANEKHRRSVNITSIPELLHLVEEVRRNKRVIVLTAKDEDVAVLSPVTRRHRPSPGRKLTEADVAAFRSAAGSWSDVDTDRLVEDIYQSRERSSRAFIEL